MEASSDAFDEPGHCSEDELLLLLRGALSPSEETMLVSHISDCSPCRDALESTIRFRQQWTGTEPRQAGAERRTEVRIKTQGTGTLRVLGPFSPKQLPVHILDMSANGAKLHVANSFPPGTTVQVRLPKTIFMGEVRYCIPAEESAFHIGIRIVDCVYY